MSLHQGSTSLPGAESSSGHSSASSASRNAVSFLLGRGSESRRESRRIAAGLLALAVLSVGLLNVGIYQSAQSRLSEDGWNRLAANTDRRQQEVLEVLRRVERQALYVAEQPMVLDWAQLAAAGQLFKVERNGLIRELDRSAASFGLDAFALYDVEGRQIVTGTGAPPPHEETAELVRRAAGSGEREIAELHHGDRAGALISVAVPMREPGFETTRTVLVAHVQVSDVLQPLLSTWPGFRDNAGGYLVTREAEQVVFISTPPGPDAIWRGTHAALSDVSVRAAAMAVVGVESNVEVFGADGRRVWAVTRQIPGLDWGLVGQADQADMMAGMRGTLFGLLLLDLAMALLGFSAFWFWRRQYRTGLARKEVQITRRHAERVQAIFDTAFDAIVTFGGDGRVRTVNRAAERLFGRSAAEMQGEPMSRYLRSASGAGYPATSQVDRDDSGPGTVLRSEAITSEGLVIPVEYSLGRAGEGDELVHTAILRDVRERVEAEQRIHAFAEGLEISNRRLEEMNAQLEEASRLKSEFLANTSHELRTPLNGMIGFLQLVLDGMCDSRDEERDYMKQAMQCSRHLLGLINDVLDIAKIEAGKLTLDISRVDVEQLFGEVHTLTHVQAAQKGIKLRFEPPDSGAVRADFGKLKQILVNLVGNSLKFTPSGSITVKATPHDELGHYMFEVIDTGIGVPKNRQRVIFEKFTQGDGSTTRRFGGTGLGLAISRSLVELMGGIIGVESEGEGKGTRMYFSLPVWRDGDMEIETENEDDHAHEEMIEGPSGGSLALIVEDDPTFRKYLVALLNQRGYRTIEAKNAESGWLLARRLHPSVVILDYALTSAETAVMRTGWDLAERLAADEQTRRIPVIFVTGFEAEVQEKLRSTAFARRPAHLVKPIEGQALIQRIEEMVGDDADRVLRILMADDDPSVAAYVRKVLPQERYIVEMATNGEECLQVLREQPKGFDLLLLDLMMPEISGWDVLREMALTGMHGELPVLVLTNFPEPRNDEERRLLEDGLVIDVIPKSRVHDNPQMLGHVIDWHMQLVADTSGRTEEDDADREERAA